MSLLISKHVKYFQLCLNSLPSKAQSEDPNKLSIIYFCLNGLSLLGNLECSDDTPYHIESIYRHLIHTKDASLQAFRSSQTFALDETKNEYDLPSLSATFFALVNLAILGEDYSAVLDRHKIMKFVSLCQFSSGDYRGSFLSVLGLEGDLVSESDLRHCYMAAAIRKMLGYDKLAASGRIHDINMEALEKFILNRTNPDGGLASESYTESHSGLTFCGIATLKLIGYDLKRISLWVEDSINWLVHRQVDYPLALYKDDYEYHDENDVGGFNGRDNKFADTCYSWWVVALLKLLHDDAVSLLNGEKAIEFLLNSTQHKLMGGFGKDKDAFPDPFHSSLALASLSLIKDNYPDIVYDGLAELESVDPELVIPASARALIDSMWRD